MATESDEGDEAIAEIASNDGDINQAATSSSPSSSNSESQPAEGAGSNNGRAMEALLIANSDYSNFPNLGSPKTDALILGDSLRKLGFATRLVENASREQMLDEIKAFEERLRSTRGIAFFHFGGHGIQVKGSNYLVPADADIPDERRVSTRAVELNEVMGALDASGSEVNIVVLDACRDNPLPASATRSATRGLAVVGNKPKNSIVIYAAEAGSKATDGLFTPVLARELATPGISLAEIMTRVRKEVNEKSGGSQTPGEYNQLFEQVYFSRGKQPVAAVAPANPTPPARPIAPEPLRRPDPTPVREPEIADPRAEKLFRQAREARVAGDMGKAIVKLEEASTQSPESPNIRYELGLVHEQMGVYDIATSHYQKIFEMGISQAGKYYDLAARKLRDGFDKPDAMLGKLSLGRVRIFKNTNYEDGEQVILTIPVQKAPTEEIDIAELAVSVVFFNRNSKGDIVQLEDNSWVNQLWTTLPFDWIGGEESLRMIYTIPKPGDGADPLFGAVSYYGQTVSLIYKGETMAVQAWPSDLYARMPRGGPGDGGSMQPEFQDTLPPDFNPDAPLLPPLPEN